MGAERERAERIESCGLHWGTQEYVEEGKKADIGEGPREDEKVGGKKGMKKAQKSTRGDSDKVLCGHVNLKQKNGGGKQVTKKGKELWGN